jgi:D-threonate/D-erythronate kinase
VVGEATTNKDVAAWAAAMNENWVLAGAGDFYTALLEKEHVAQTQQKIELLSPYLYVCGTSFAQRKQFIKELDCCLYMQEENDEIWLQQASIILKEQKKLVVAIDESEQTALELRTTMAKLVNEIVARENVPEIFIEGGSTAAAVLEELGIKKLTPVNELSRGVVRMKAGNLFITVKPGSYQLPEAIKLLFTH